MALDIYKQLYCFFIFIITGILIGILFDIFRITRKSFKTPDVITYIEDFAFWMITGLLLLWVIFKFNDGEIRGYIFVGLGIGITIYLLTISKIFIKVSVTIITFLNKIISGILNFLIKILKIAVFNPIYFLVLNIKKPINLNFVKKREKKLKSDK